MPRIKVAPEETRVPMPLRLRPRFKQRLHELAASWRVSPGEWVEAQLDPYMPKEKPPASKAEG